MQARLEAVWKKDAETWSRLTADEFTVVVPEGKLMTKADRLAAVELLQAVFAVTHRKEKTHVYEVRPGKDRRGVGLISDALPFGRLWYAEPDATSNAIGYANFRSRSHPAVIRVYDEAGNESSTFVPKSRSRRMQVRIRLFCLR
jgi:hypothetical protein